METEIRLAKSLLDLARRIVSENEPRERKAYGLVQNPQKVIKGMRDKGIALNYDGSLWTFPVSEFGVPNYSQAPRNYAKNAEAAVSKTGQISDSLKSKIDRYSELLDDITKFKRMLLGMNVSSDTINDMLFYFKNDLEEHINPRVRDPQLKSINSELSTIKQKVSDGDFKGAVKNASIIQDLIARELMDKWQSQHDFFKMQRKTMMEISRMLSRTPEAVLEIATIGTPPEEQGEGAPVGPTQKLLGKDGSERLVKELQRMVKLHGVAEFTYEKKDGSIRPVRVAPTEIKRTSKGMIIVGYDLDRKAERVFFVEGIQ